MQKLIVYKLSDNWSLHRESLETVKHYLFNIDGGDIIKLNSVSFDMLSFMDGTSSLENILDKISAGYDVDMSTLRNDLTVLIDKCLAKNILEKFE